MSLRNVTIADNQADSRGGGLFITGSSVPPAEAVVEAVLDGSIVEVAQGTGVPSQVLSSILWDNAAPIPNGGSQIYLEGADIDIDYSDVEGGELAIRGTGTITWGDNNIGGDTTNDDPDFIDPTSTNGNYRLLCGSPCVNTGTTAGHVPDSQDVDEDMNFSESTPDADTVIRVIRSQFDMGAYEARTLVTCPGDIYPSPSPGVPGGDCVVDVNDLGDVFINWGKPSHADFADSNGATCGGDGTTDVNDLGEIFILWTGDENPPCDPCDSPPQVTSSTGACCLSDGTICQDGLSWTSCAWLEGVWQGWDTDCDGECSVQDSDGDGIPEWLEDCRSECGDEDPDCMLDCIAPWMNPI